MVAKTSLPGLYPKNQKIKIREVDAIAIMPKKIIIFLYIIPHAA